LSPLAWTPSSSAEAPIKVLFVEDDERLARLTTRYLTSRGLLVSWTATGPEAIAEAWQRQFDVILLDLMLPGRDGMEVCRTLRTRTDVPIIILTARKDEVDRVLGLDAGADDYVTKPFSSRELVSRIRAVVRRARGLVGPRLGLIEAGVIIMDPASMRVTVSGREVTLTGYEFALLKVLAERVGRVLSREQLLDLAKGSAEEAYDRSIDVQISKLRQKIGDDARQPRYLKTVRGTGYMLVSGQDD
jgi:two-component system, OmpR family, response regulator